MAKILLKHYMWLISYAETNPLVITKQFFRHTIQRKCVFSCLLYIHNSMFPFDMFICSSGAYAMSSTLGSQHAQPQFLVKPRFIINTLRKPYYHSSFS